MSEKQGSSSPCVVLAHEHPAMLRSLKRLLEPEFEVVAMADNVLSLMDALEAHRASLVVLGLSVGLGGGAFARHLVARKPDRRVVVVAETDPAVARELLDAGCSAFVATATADDDLLLAAREVLQGGTFLSASVSTGLTPDRHPEP